MVEDGRFLCAYGSEDQINPSVTATARAGCKQESDLRNQGIPGHRGGSRKRDKAILMEWREPGMEEESP
jgi:hypothetical protein